MARDYYDESKKKKETKQKAKSPSVTKKNNTRTQQAQNQKTYGGVQKPVQRSTTKQTSQRTQQAQQQKSQGDVQRRVQQSTPIQRRTNAESNNLLKQRRIYTDQYGTWQAVLLNRGTVTHALILMIFTGNTFDSLRIVRMMMNFYISY